MAASSASAYAEAIDSAARMAQRDLDAVIGKLDPSKPVECKAALLAAVPAIVEKYGAVAALAAAEHYAGQRRAAIGGGFEPLLADPVERGAVEAKVRYALGHVFDGGGSHGET